MVNAWQPGDDFVGDPSWYNEDGTLEGCEEEEYIDQKSIDEGWKDLEFDPEWEHRDMDHPRNQNFIDSEDYRDEF